MAHVTFGFVVPLSEALNWIDWLGARVAVVGDTATDTAATSVMATVAILVGSAALVAFTVTVWAEAMVAGAV
jgi:hypothetical protein